MLALTLADAKLYEGTRETLDPVDLDGAPTTIAEALGPELTEPYSKVTRGAGGAGGGAGSKAPMHQGQGGRKDERPIDRERFFRIVDREILERASKISRLPLVLAALPEHQAHFRALSHMPGTRMPRPRTRGFPMCWTIWPRLPCAPAARSSCSRPRACPREPARPRYSATSWTESRSVNCPGLKQISRQAH